MELFNHQLSCMRKNETFLFSLEKTKIDIQSINCINFRTTNAFGTPKTHVVVSNQNLSRSTITTDLHQEKMRDREGDAQSSPWDILTSVKLFLDGTKTEVCFPRGPQSQQARVVAILNIHQQPLHNAISTSSDEFI